MSIPEGGIIVRHDFSSYHLALHELGLIQPATDNNGKEVEVQIYKKEVDADRSGAIAADREILDTDGSGKIQPVEVWDFFTRNLPYLTKDGVLNVLVTLREKIKSSPRPLPPESTVFKSYHALFTKASVSEDEDIRAKGQVYCLIIQDINGRTIASSAKYGYEGCR
jgi:hypothetical protein